MFNFFTEWQAARIERERQEALDAERKEIEAQQAARRLRERTLQTWKAGQERFETLGFKFFGDPAYISDESRAYCRDWAVGPDNHPYLVTLGGLNRLDRIK